MGWFVSASFVSLMLGLIMVNLLQPGANFPCTLPDKAQSTGLPVSAFSIEKFLTHLIPTSIADAMAQNEILQIVIFAVFFSVAMGSMPERSKPILALIDDLGHIMLKVTSYVMLFALLAVWAAITATVAKNGLLVLWKLIVFMGGFYLSLFLVWGILVIVGFIVIGARYSHLLKLIREPLMIAFSTASSEAAYPKTLEGLNQLRRLVANLELRAAARLFLQSRRHDDVLHLRQHLHRAELSHRHAARHAACDAGDVDDHLQGRRRRAARLPRGDRLDAVAVRHPRGGPVDDHGHRHLPRHGPQRHQRDRQHARDLGGGEVGRRARARACAWTGRRRAGRT